MSGAAERVSSSWLDRSDVPRVGVRYWATLGEGATPESDGGDVVPKEAGPTHETCHKAPAMITKADGRQNGRLRSDDIDDGAEAGDVLLATAIEIPRRSARRRASL
jgi:hypothetical protein